MHILATTSHLFINYYTSYFLFPYFNCMTNGIKYIHVYIFICIVCQCKRILELAEVNCWGMVFLFNWYCHLTLYYDWIIYITIHSIGDIFLHCHFVSRLEFNLIVFTSIWVSTGNILLVSLINSEIENLFILIDHPSTYLFCEGLLSYSCLLSRLYIIFYF